ncbi:type II toxin-antitoxin system VapC family toxin [bacterium]|nr:type II toxin-antitoxin system VapC family toxin [bacterium]
MKLVIDCSIAMSWCFEDEISEEADKILNEITRYELVVPVLWWFEISNVLVVAERKKRMKSAHSNQFIRTLKMYPFTVDTLQVEHRLDDILAFARKHLLTFYDASYLELAHHMDCALATKDKALIKACSEAKIKVFS